MQRITHCLTCGKSIAPPPESIVWCDNQHRTISYVLSDIETEIIILYDNDYIYTWAMKLKVLEVTKNLGNETKNSEELIWLEPNLTDLDKLCYKLSIRKNIK